MRAPERRLKKWHIVLIVILSLILICYLIFAAMSYSRYTMYNPFTGKVFRIDVEEVSFLKIGNGDTGNMVIYEDKSEIKEVADILNGLRCRRWKPDPPGERGGWSYGVCIFGNEEDYYWYTFNEEAILAGDIWFFVTNDSLKGLAERVQGPPEEVE